MRDEILRIASHVPHPLAVAGFSILLAIVVIGLAARAKKLLAASLLILMILGLGLAPLAATHLLRARDIYHVRVVLIRPDESVADVAQVKSSITGELKMVGDGWQLDVPPENRPADGKITFSASVKDEFFAGKTTLVLAEDYYPTATIQLAAVTSAMLRGVVVDDGMRAIAGAKVSIDGYPEVVLTDAKGNFVLPAHAGNGQMVAVRAQKGALVGHLSAPTGKVVEVILGSD